VPPNVTYHLLSDAMAAFDEAEKLGGPTIRDAILRWNAASVCSPPIPSSRPRRPTSRR